LLRAFNLPSYRGGLRLARPYPKARSTSPENWRPTTGSLPSHASAFRA
jgi:hypothetical protein